MEFKEKQLNIENGLSKEWLITNGIGGYASSTIIGANTRKYHGLLIAPFTPPARRFLILSKVDESIQIENENFDLYTNVCKNYISQGFKYQTSFKKEYVPIFKYAIKDVKIEKTICMKHRENTVGIYYKIKNGNKRAILKLAPIVNYRDFHTMNTGHEFNVRQEVNKTEVKLIVDGNSTTPIYMKLSEGTYKCHNNDTFYNMFYVEEEKRGFYPEENHSVTGVFEVELAQNEEKEISFICSLEAITKVDVKKMIEKEIARIDKICDESKLLDKKNKTLIKDFIMATDNFVVYRPSFRLHTLIAGYPWFLDWGRDSLIAFEGLLLATNRYNLAKEILLTYVRDIKDSEFF